MSSPGFPVRADWLARVREDVIEPDIPIIDPHHHIYDRSGESYLLDDLLADVADGHNVVTTVFVQCRFNYLTDGPDAMRPLGEVEQVLALASESRRRGIAICGGIVAGIDLILGDAIDPVLGEFRRLAGQRASGIRNSVAWNAHPDVRSSAMLPPPGLMADPRYRAGVRRLAAHRLTLDIWAYQTQLIEVLDLARTCSDTTIIIDHLGGPLAVGPYKGRRDELFSAWKADLAKLAAIPTTRIKLGGLGMKVGGFAFHEAADPPSSRALADAWRPYVETAISLFGVDRCMFESNFPVDKGMYGYRVFWNACKRLAEGCSADEKAALFSRTAAAVYQLPPTEREA